MKNYLLHIIMFTFVVACLSGLTGKIAAEGIRIVPQSVTVKNDSLHLWLEMDLNSVHVNSLAAVIFTPELAGKKGSSQKITLPSVVITGGKRFRFERRERALATSAENREILYYSTTTGPVPKMSVTGYPFLIPPGCNRPPCCSARK
ncbi:DUF3868 domain-containing protein [Parabacteroides goldsteinii]|uniref:DUF3868 domain-containing protein n=1 Tax=Parabacteroides goldsteinii TaxID=328812 RepID=UPI0027305EF9|nr:DUF3868 domain-containing protein [Parabacteroides goldsteinii]